MTLGLWAALLAYGVVLAVLIGAVPGGSDTSGYFNEARLFSRFRIHEPLRVLPGLPASVAPPYLYVPLGYKPAPDGSGTLVPTYPPGLALMLVPVAKLAGWRVRRWYRGGKPSVPLQTEPVTYGYLGQSICVLEPSRPPAHIAQWWSGDNPFGRG